MEAAPRGYWLRMSWVALGVVAGVFAALWLRVLYYEWMQLQPNMAPQMAYAFAPIIIGGLLVIAGFFEAGFSRYWFAVHGRPTFFLVPATPRSSSRSSRQLRYCWQLPIHWPCASFCAAGVAIMQLLSNYELERSGEHRGPRLTAAKRSVAGRSTQR
jgi:hypothetical protein